MARSILEGDAARTALLRGVDTMAALLRPTLGPLPRTVAIARLSSSDQAPEILDSGATIARRTLQLADPFEDMGGMLIRHLVWQVFERVGDGTATAAVLAQATLRAALVPGANPVGIRRGVERALAVATLELRRGAQAIDGPDDIARLVRSTLGDDDLAQVVGEVVDAAGADGAILVEDAQQTRTSHEYIDGVRWNEGYASTFLLPEEEVTAARLLNPRILITDSLLERAEQLVPVLEACVRAGERSLFIIAPEIRDSAIGLLVVNRQRGVFDSVMVVGAPSVGDQRMRILEDLAVITGGRFVSEARGDRLQNVSIDDFGRARQAWATRAAFGIVGGVGDKADVRRRIADARAELNRVPPDDAFTSNKIRERIGKLAGTTAIVRVGAPTAAEQAELKLRVDAAVRSARSALADGVVAGGGAALLRCSAVLGELALDADEALGVRALRRALAEPMRVILANAGLHPATFLERVRRCDVVYDVVRRQWLEPYAAGLVDPLAVQLAALEGAGSTAATALTADVLVHRKNPPTSMRP